MISKAHLGLNFPGHVWLPNQPALLSLSVLQSPQSAFQSADAVHLFQPVTPDSFELILPERSEASHSPHLK